MKNMSLEDQKERLRKFNSSRDREAIAAEAALEADCYRLFGCSLADATAPRAARSSSVQTSSLDTRYVLFRCRLPFGKGVVVTRNTCAPTRNAAIKAPGRIVTGLAIRLWRRIAGKADPRRQHPSASRLPAKEAVQVSAVRQPETARPAAKSSESSCVNHS